MRKLYDSGIYQSKWCTKINDILNKVGLSFIWRLEDVNQKHLKSGLKLRLSDIDKQEWLANVQSAAKVSILNGGFPPIYYWSHSEQ